LRFLTANWFSIINNYGSNSKDVSISVNCQHNILQNFCQVMGVLCVMYLYATVCICKRGVRECSNIIWGNRTFRHCKFGLTTFIAATLGADRFLLQPLKRM